MTNEKETFGAPFQIASTFKPGDVMKRMALPWQADFYECNTHWWPAQRPDNVATEKEYKRILRDWKKLVPPADEPQESSDSLAAALAYRPLWARGLGVNPDNAAPESALPGDNDMVKFWHELGFVVKKKGPKNEEVFIEMERHPNAGMDERNLFYKLQNVDEYPDILEKAKEFTVNCLQQGRDYANDPSTPDLWRGFPYSKELFEARMLESYSSFVDHVEYNPGTDTVFKTRADVVERIIQMAPFNLTDGSWLRHINVAGPEDEVRALLFSVLQDERGNGDPSMNHCNIYLDLCHSVGFYPPSVASEGFASNKIFLDSAFTLPAFELAISQFSQNYYPELLGMTLQLEWSVVELKPTIKLLEYFGINPHFYVMHVGIDNAVNGHGRRAIDAVKLYLDNVFEAGGEAAMQEQWQRIWNGYVTFGILGTLGDDLQNLIQNKPTYRDQMIQLIESKQEFGSLNHDTHTLGANKINDWFSDPDGFLDELIKSGYIIPGDPDRSRFFTLLEFETGPMFRVFADQEIELFKNWTRSLVAKPSPTQPGDAALDMVRLVVTLKQQQTDAPDHGRMYLKIPGTETEKSVTWWFAQNPNSFMEALADEGNKWVVKGDPDHSRFVSELIAPENAMGKAFAGVIPDTGGKTGNEIVIQWIKVGCPIIKRVKKGGQKLWLTSSVEEKIESMGKKIKGMGTIH